jgi:hypothetical protein
MAHDQTQVRLGLGRRLGKTERVLSVGECRCFRPATYYGEYPK